MKGKSYLFASVALVFNPLLLLAAQGNQKMAGAGFEHVHALAIDAVGQTLFLGTHTGLFKSEDSGRSWKQMPLPGNHPHLDVMAVTPHPKDPKTFYIGTHEGGVLKSTDGGATWNEVNSGLAGLDVHGIAVDPNDGKLHALIREKGEGIYRSTNGGARWTRVDDGPGGEVKGLYSVNISTGMGGIFLYAATAEGLQRNPDCFWGWTKVVGGLPANRTVNGFAVDPENPKVMYVAVRDGLFKSTDAGETWKPMGSGLKNLASVTANPKKPNEIYTASMQAVIFKSTDGGTTWKRQQ